MVVKRICEVGITSVDLSKDFYVEKLARVPADGKMVLAGVNK